MAHETITLTQIADSFKKNTFKFERLKSDLTLLAGLLDGAIIVKPQSEYAADALREQIDNETIGDGRNVRPALISVDTPSIKDLVNQIRETL